MPMLALLPTLLCTALVDLLSRSDRAPALGPATALLVVLATPLGWALAHLPEGLQHLRLMALLAALLPLALLALKLIARRYPTAPGLLPALLANGAAIASVLMFDAAQREWLPSLGLGVLAGLGFWLILRLLGDLLARAENANVPAPLRGAPLALIGSGLMGLVLLGVVGR
ncbi:Rnf-Nqr domain containing protein [Pseudomonas sp. PS02288]|uniref:Rnf-Nqr domain containing protein n=1 Tax=Pseudomonas sp. PS02288 TaxID=2991443 RepID=UPI00249C5141|nr:Rnf-Nqr domain containing protein [Pseudomonas sp. PS02288]